MLEWDNSAISSTKNRAMSSANIVFELVAVFVVCESPWHPSNAARHSLANTESSSSCSCSNPVVVNVSISREVIVVAKEGAEQDLVKQVDSLELLSFWYLAFWHLAAFKNHTCLSQHQLHKPHNKAMEGLFFNIDSGYLEGVVRGYKNSLITQAQYLNLTQCDSLDDVKLQLSATDYGNFLNDISQTLSTSIIEQKLNLKLIKDFNYIKSQSTDPLSKFLDFISYSYMIDNILLILTGTIHNRDKNEILKKCNPLGWFDTLPTLSITTDLNSLYQTVLIDTPLAKYFHSCLTINDLDDLNIEIIRNTLYKEYLEDFHNFCVTQLPSPSNEVMDRLLSFEADKRSINILINSFSSNEVTAEDKNKMLPSIGLLSNLKEQLTHCTDLEVIKSLITSVGAYSNFFDESSTTTSSASASLEDKFYAHEMYMNKNALTQQFTHSTVWAVLKSREQEIRNITWICECISQNQRDRIGNYIAVY